MSEAEQNIEPEDQEPITEEALEETQDSAPDEEKIAALVTALQTENAALKDQALRAMAEAENTRRRAMKDKEDASKFAIANFARDLLSVADNLRRALDAMPEEADQNMVTGIEATERELLRSFEKNGIEKINPVDEPFDPNLHEVMLEIPSPDKPPGTIIQVMEPGYTLKGRILRPARVGVVKDDGQGAPNKSTEDRPGGNIDLDA